MPDLYYRPEAFGVTTIGEIEWSEPCYSFDLTVLWHRASDGMFFWASDSGCSCPSPFENIDLETADSGTFWDFTRAITEHLNACSSQDYAGPQVVELLSRARNL